MCGPPGLLSNGYRRLIPVAEWPMLGAKFPAPRDNQQFLFRLTQTRDFEMINTLFGEMKNKWSKCLCAQAI
jgi:hypothetical protein